MVYKYMLVDTAFGWVSLLGSSRGLCRLALPEPSLDRVRRSIDDLMPTAVPDDQFFGSLPSDIQRYFQHEQMEFHVQLDLSGYTPFQLDVWRITRAIPYGETTTYGKIAEILNRPGSSRAVGRIMGKNPVPIVIPCHRVIGSKGNLTGFRGGLDMKKRLLDLESSAIPQQSE